MTADAEKPLVEPKAHARADGSSLRAALVPLQAVWATVTHPIRALLNRLSLFAKIALLNAIAFLLLVIAILSINQHEAWLITAKRDALEVQGKIIVEAIINRLSEQEDQRGFGDADADDARPPLPVQRGDRNAARFSISPDLVAPLLGQLLESSETRGRLWDPKGGFISDSNNWSQRFYRSEKRSARNVKQKTHFLERVWTGLSRLLQANTLERYVEHGRDEGLKYAVVATALASNTSQPTIMEDDRGNQIVGVALPIRTEGTTLGVLFLTTKSGALDELVTRERQMTVLFFAMAALVMLALSFALRQMIVGPTRELAEAADHVGESLNAKNEIMEFPIRQDEIGTLAEAFRKMTNSLLKRIDDGERFAADVSHEIKNPLTAVRSAAESLGKAKREEDRQMLIRNIITDVDRLNRLITDISNATRLDAEMALRSPEPFDLAEVIANVVEMLQPQSAALDVTIKISDTANVRLGDTPFGISGHAERIAQVFTNVISNALSFAPEASTISIEIANLPGKVRVTVEDEGPGIPEAALDRIFRRFYTDRERGRQHAWGENSGLGLSISKDIIEAHHGKLWAENRMTGDDETPEGARFIIELPSRPPKQRRHQR